MVGLWKLMVLSANLDQIYRLLMLITAASALNTDCTFELFLAVCRGENSAHT